MTGATLKQKLLAVPDDVSSPRFIVGVRVARSLVVCVLFYRSLFVFLLAIVLSVFRFTASGDLFGILKLLYYSYTFNVDIVRIKFSRAVVVVIAW